MFSTLNGNQRENTETPSSSSESITAKNTPSTSTFAEDLHMIDASHITEPSSSPGVTSADIPNLMDEIATSIESITEISTSISLIKTELTLKESEPESQSFAAERRNTFAEAENPTVSHSTQPYEQILHSNASTKIESLSSTGKTIPLETEAILNMTKRKEEGDFGLDYDEPTLPPSLPNLK